MWVDKAWIGSLPSDTTVAFLFIFIYVYSIHMHTCMRGYFHPIHMLYFEGLHLYIIYIHTHYIYISYICAHTHTCRRSLRTIYICARRVHVDVDIPGYPYKLK